MTNDLKAVFSFDCKLTYFIIFKVNNPWPKRNQLTPT